MGSSRALQVGGASAGIGCLAWAIAGASWRNGAGDFTAAVCFPIACAAAAWAVAKTARNPIEAGVRLLKMAAAGKRFLAGHNYSAHYTVEGVCQAEVNAKLALLRKAMEGVGTETANTIPTVIRAMPFIPLYPILGPKGERWVPQHGILPFSKLSEFHQKLQKLYGDNAERMRKAKVDKGAMYMTINTHAFLYEPVFYWEDSRTNFHKRFLPAEYLGMLPEYPENPEGRALVRELRQRICEIFAAVGAVHMQVGKSYPYMVGRDPEAARLAADPSPGPSPSHCRTRRRAPCPSTAPPWCPCRPWPRRTGNTSGWWLHPATSRRHSSRHPQPPRRTR